jgi:outer membrane receptor protein involved in Fe transport
MKLIHSLLALTLPMAALAQTAQITGRITDASQAVLVGANVSVINTETGVRRMVETNSEGFFTAPLLRNGNYRIEVQQAGFKNAVRTDVRLDEGQVLRTDFALELGQVTESVEVTGAAPLLETERPTISTVIANQKIVDLPTSGRNPLQFALLVPGVRATGLFGDIPISAFDGSRASIGGGSPSVNNYMVDGIAAENFTSGGLQTPLSIDATEEFRLIVRNPSAEFGRSGGGFINLISKAGTNEFHGNLYNFHRNENLNANDFFSNRAGRSLRNPLVFNQFGATLGGPIKKDRTFFFFNWEKLVQRSQARAIRTVPTDPQRTGDFSQTRAGSGALVAIHDPFSTRMNPAVPGQRIRDAFPGNRIPVNLLSPQALAVTEYYPRANTQGAAFTDANNFLGEGSAPLDKDVYGLRLDHYLNPLRRIAGRYTWDRSFRGTPNFYNNLAEIQTSDLIFQRHSAFLSYSDAIRPNLLIDIRGGLNFYLPDRTTRSIGFDVSTLKMPASLNAEMQVPSFPRFNVTDMTAIGADQGDTLVQSNKAWSYIGTLTWIRGSHNLKFGSDNRVYQLNNTQGFAGMTFGFGRSFTQGPNPNTAGATSGFGLATFLLGTPTGGELPRNTAATYTLKNFGLFVQDDWRLTSKLTINLGLRWEYEGGVTDRFDAISNFNPNLAFTAGGRNLVGGLQFAGVDGLSRGHRDPSSREFQPRVGFAYQVLPRTVLRGGYSISHLPTSGITVQIPRFGFSVNTPVLASVDGGFTPNASLANPFPSGIQNPTGSSLGPLTGLGQGVSGDLRTLKRGYSQQWSFSVQRELFNGWVVEAGYMGNRGVSLPAGRTFDYLPEQYRALGTGLQQLVPNPFFGIISPSLALGAAQVTQASLLDAYPHFAGASGLDSWGDSVYHAGTLRVEKRFSQGLSFLLSYTFSKLIDNNQGNGNNAFSDSGANDVRNWDDLRGERSVSSNDLPQRLVISASYELPFGKTGPAVVRYIAGGWQLNTIASFQSGNVISVTQNTPAFGANRPNVAGDPSLANPTIDGWINRAAFVNSPAFTFGNVARNLPRTRSDGLNNFDISVLKSFAFTERIRLQFRAEAFNAFNTVTFGNPAGNIDAGNFGTVTTQATNTNARVVQLALKLLF